MPYAFGITAVLVATAFFARAEAPKAPAPALPQGWRELPELALPARPGPVAIESRRGAGDPASGCYALVQRATGEHAKAPAARAALVAGLRKRGLEVSGEGEELAVSGLGVEGRIRTTMRDDGAGRLAAVSTACFFSSRRPDRCKSQCDALLERLGGGS